MLSSVLRSPRAVAVNIEIMRAFVRLRQMLFSHAELARKVECAGREIRRPIQGRFRRPAAIDAAARKTQTRHRISRQANAMTTPMRRVDAAAKHFDHLTTDHSDLFHVPPLPRSRLRQLPVGGGRCAAAGGIDVVRAEPGEDRPAAAGDARPAAGGRDRADRFWPCSGRR